MAYLTLPRIFTWQDSNVSGGGGGWGLGVRQRDLDTKRKTKQNQLQDALQSDVTRRCMVSGDS